jgi:hypothetical protein
VFVSAIDAEGAPSLRFLQEPALSGAEGTGHPLFCCAREVKSLGHPPRA